MSALLKRGCPNVSERQKTGWCSVTVNTEAKGSPRHLQSALKGWERDSCHADSKPTEVCRAGVLIKSSSVTFYKNSLIYRELLYPKRSDPHHERRTMKPFYVTTLYYLPMQYAIALVNSGHTEDDAAKQAIERFAYYGKHHTKRLKEFDQNRFRKHLYKFLNTPHAILIRKTPAR